MTDKEKYVPYYKCSACGEIFKGTPIFYTPGYCFGIHPYEFHICRNGKECIGILYGESKENGDKMTDKEIGKTAREIAERGNTAEVKRNKDGIVILEVGKKIVRKDNVPTNKKL